MMKKIILLLILFLISVPSAFAIGHASDGQSPFDSKVDVEVISNDKKGNKDVIKDAVYIKDIQIEGVNIIKPEYIINRLQMNKGDEYSRDLIQTDLKNIYKTGFFSDRMKAIPIQNPDGSLTLKIVLEENAPIIDFTLDGNDVVSSEEILTFLEPLRGNPQNIDDINSAIEKIQGYYNTKGYILASIDSIYDDPDGTLNIHINEGEIDRILISGNLKTKDYVIARNILTEAGTIYNEELIRQDLVRLYATQAFKDVKREIEPSERNPEKYDVTILVEEQRTASLSVGGGLDSATGIFGSVGIADNNFRGLNQRVGLNVLAGSGMVLNNSAIVNRMNIQAELSFFEPYFLNSDNSLMSKLFFRDFGSYQVPLAIERRYGVEATIAHKLRANKNLSSTFTLGLERVSVREGDESQVRSLYAKNNIPISYRSKQLEGGTYLSLSPGLVYDTRDTTVNPRNGILANVRFDEAVNVADLSGSYGKLTGSVKKFLPIAKKSSLSFSARAGGRLWGEMPEVMGYRLGGPYTIRGFRMSGVGTGQAFAMGSAELAVPIPLLDKLKIQFLDNVRLTLFMDAGKVFSPYVSDRIYDRPMHAVTAGVGLKVYIPGMGPLSVDYGIPLTNPGTSGSKGYFTFGVGDMMY